MARTRKEQLPVEQRAALPFAKRISELIDMKDNGNASELAKELQCSPQAISQFRNGNSYPKVENIIKIAQHFHVTSDYLLGLTDCPSPDATARATCDYTGLSTKATNKLHNRSSGLMSFPFYVLDPCEYTAIVSGLIEAPEFDSLVEAIYNALHEEQKSNKYPIELAKKYAECSYLLSVIVPKINHPVLKSLETVIEEARIELLRAEMEDSNGKTE